MVNIITEGKVYFDIKTKNTSFIKISKELRENGIQSYMFPLMIYDKDLIGVDPHDPNLTATQKSRIIIECKRNIWYFIREVARVPVPGGHVMFELHRGNLAMIFCLWLNLDTSIELPRQHYKTYSAVFYYLWLLLLKAENYEMVFTNKSNADSIRNLKRLTDLLDPSKTLTPPYMRTPLGPNDTNNQERLTITSLNNTIRVVSPSNSPENADKAGRGMTVPIIWLDEMAFIKFCNVMYGAMRPAFTTASKFARKNKTPYSVLITTTPSDLDSENGIFTYNLIQSACRWDEKMYDWYFNAGGGDEGEAYIRNYVEENSQNNFIYIEYSYKELGKDDKWLAKQVKELNNDMSLVKRELLLEWTHTSVDSVFSEETLDRIARFAEQKNINDYQKIYFHNNKYAMYIIEDLGNMVAMPWLVSADIGGGLSQDRTVLTVIDPFTSRVKALLISNTMPVDELEEVVVEMKKLYFPKMIFAPERNYSGDYLIKNLFKNKEVDFTDSITYYRLSDSLLKKRTKPNDELFNSQTTISSSKSRRSKDVAKYEYGVNTNVKTRTIMVENILFNLVEEHPELINNPFIFSELKTLVRTKTGKIEHQSGAHDDIIMSYLIGLYVLQHHTEVVRKYFSHRPKEILPEPYDDRPKDLVTSSDGSTTSLPKSGVSKTLSTIRRVTAEETGGLDLMYERQKILQQTNPNP